ncbi:hypothetical protein A2160_00625 [Candidatus Beckwithbacteria bacterium RBG_13_42_9]|uniref:Uncharacterized protein n=1 Tax=Candidatus Beckwithbacteria bacterium RBG_13_42_9 TaxID=1797457 RepID=A0A1F5E4T5_9BACT|nr:MAG: hypothetical protein A2160_00625 [Candidatus Beckwithbacteria bacterium RBG_13_42_9]
MLQLTLPGKDMTITEPATFKFAGSAGTLGKVISELLKYIFPIAGLILLFMLIAGGFQLLTSAGNPETTKAGQARVVSALIGFVIVFVAWWLMQIVETVLGFKILG